MLKQKCVIELGSTKVNCILSEIDDDKTLKILASVTLPSEGIQYGSIVDPIKLTKVVRSCLSKIEKKTNIIIKKINVILETPEFSCTRISKHKKIDGSKIQKDDIVFLLKESKKEATDNDKKKKIIHIFNHNYIVDGKQFVKEPIGVYADNLSHEMTFISVPLNTIKNLNEVFIECDLEIERLISSTFALAVNFLNNTEFELGATLVDIGFEKTSLGIFKNFALIHSITFPIGIHHVTKDISRGCSLTLKESEYIKDQLGCSLLKSESNLNNNNLPENFFKETRFRKITKALVSEIIIARIEEIMNLVKKEVYSMGSTLSHSHNLYIVGGGSQLPYLKQFCSNFFSRGTNILESPEKNFNQNIFASCNGALKIIYFGWETEAIPSNVDKTYKKLGFLSKMLGYWTKN